jgi:hypothetical protein
MNRRPTDPPGGDTPDSFAGVTNVVEHIAPPLTRIAEAAENLLEQGSHPTRVELDRPQNRPTLDTSLWMAIKNRSNAINFANYSHFIDRILCTNLDEGVDGCSNTQNARDMGSPSIVSQRDALLRLPSIYGVDSYELLRQATEAFLLYESGVVIIPPRNPASGIPGSLVSIGDESKEEQLTYEEMRERLENYLQTGVRNNRGLPYLKLIAQTLLDKANPNPGLPYCSGVVLRNRFTCPSMLELIWSYWHEEGMLVQTLNSISLRFQNKRSSNGPDPLAGLEIDPLRPLNNILWGFIQDEQNRLTVPRRVYEYDHAYGLTMIGKAVPKIQSVDSRSKFIEAFHHLLHRVSVFYRLDSDTTVIADGFPLLNTLREVHLLLAEGAHNQFGDLPWTARVEMLMMQWILARPEIREFIRGRAMVPYREPWMGQVDSMKKLQGWDDVTVTHFHNLAIFGEQLLLSIRYGNWNAVDDHESAKNWARYWRAEIQNYLHAYQAVTTVDLTIEGADSQQLAARAVQPSVLIQRRLNAKSTSSQTGHSQTQGSEAFYIASGNQHQRPASSSGKARS